MVDLPILGTPEWRVTPEQARHLYEYLSSVEPVEAETVTLSVSPVDAGDIVIVFTRAQFRQLLNYLKHVVETAEWISHIGEEAS